MKKTFLITFFLSTIISAFGQIAISNEKGVRTFYPDTSEACNSDMIFTIVEKSKIFIYNTFKLKEIPN